MGIIKEVEGLIWGDRNICIKFSNKNIKNDDFIDLYTNESHSVTAKTSKYPTQNGYVVSDNIEVQPRQLTLSGFISNIEDVPYTLGLVGISSNNKVMDAWSYLNNAFDKADSLNVMTTVGIYTNMIIVGLNIPKINAVTGTNVNFTIKFQENPTSESSYEKITSDTISKNSGISNAIDKKNSGTIISPDTNVSVLSDLLGVK